MKQIEFTQFRDHLSQYMAEAKDGQIVVMEHGRPVGVFTGFGAGNDWDDDWFDFQLENDPRFFKKIEDSRASIRAGQAVSWEEIKREDDERNTKRSTR
uniref:Antitoxin n=1 Tax=Candidatus Kentrum eta TaxID=2126337 RepID=A0A450U675_9GAMM|nr:MAG: prevent-host-death family protein [Candidatus Kentron sp. H]VFJ88685.1 MAG: prevent-host-death family protein [Candidatus Kentron sp. H]VFJ94953.1 MAG: prevent-host-death family protein [Candidatus Kentron sp. H]